VGRTPFGCRLADPSGGTELQSSLSLAWLGMTPFEGLPLTFSAEVNFRYAFPLLFVKEILSKDEEE